MAQLESADSSPPKDVAEAVAEAVPSAVSAPSRAESSASQLAPIIPSDQVTSLPHGERWFLDGFSVIPAPRGIVTRLCEASRIKETLQLLRKRGLPATYTQIFVRAVALGLRRVPEAHTLVCGYRRLQPGTVDIGLSVAGRTNYAPVLVIPRADELTLPELSAFLHREVPATREKEVRDLEGMMRTGWVIPFGPVRRFIMRLLQRSLVSPQARRDDPDHLHAADRSGLCPDDVQQRGDRLRAGLRSGHRRREPASGAADGLVDPGARSPGDGRQDGR